MTKLMTLEDCYQSVFEETFQLQPKDYRDENPIWPGCVGLEIEMLPVEISGNNNRPKNVALQSPMHSLKSYLAELAGEQKWVPAFDPETNFLMSIDLGEGDQITFEPGGQLEFSSRPYECLADATARMKQIQTILDDFLKTKNIQLVQLGLNPWHSPDDLGLQMPKARYQAMDQYFQKIGPFGRRMMRQTCTVQVNLDFGPDETAMWKRYVASWLIAPFASAIFTNSCIQNGIPDPKKIKGLRSEAWLYIDPSRTGIIPLENVLKNVGKKACVDSYLNFALNANVVFVTNDSYRVPQKPVAFRHWLDTPINGFSPTYEDWKTHLSLLFPEVRARGFLELRSIDCQPRAWQAIPALFYTGILYHNETCEKVIELLSPLASQVHSLREKSIFGLEDKILREYSAKIFELAMVGYEHVPPCYRSNCSSKLLNVFFENFTSKALTISDTILGTMKNQGESQFTLKLLRSLEDSWLRLMEKV